MSSLISYSLNQSEDGSQFSAVFDDGMVKTVSDTHPNFKKILQVVGSQEDGWENVAGDLMSIVATLKRKFQDLTPRVSTDGTSIFFDGDEIDSSLSRYILKLMHEASDPELTQTESDVTWEALVKFLELLYANPYAQSRESLYAFIQRYGLTIRKDGYFIAYKGVKSDFGSINQGYGIVDGLEFNGSLANKPGSTLRFPRAKVEADTSIGCATGLHAGTLAYASSWSVAAGKVVAVAINPMHVVSVPDCSSFQKIRVCEYEVLLEIDVPKESRATQSPSDSEVFWKSDDTEAYVSDGGKVSVGDVINFDYVSQTNRKSSVTGFKINDIYYGTATGVRSDGETRSYIVQNMSNVLSAQETPEDQDFLSSLREALRSNAETPKAEQPAPPTESETPEDFDFLDAFNRASEFGKSLADNIAGLLEGCFSSESLDDETEPIEVNVGSVLNFTYTAFGQTKVVTGVTVTGVSEDGALLKVVNSDGAHRSYRIAYLTNVEIANADEANSTADNLTDIGKQLFDFLKSQLDEK